MATNEPKDIGKLFRDSTLINAALNAAVRDAVQLHKERGLPLVTERDGKIVWISAEEAEQAWAAQSSHRPAV